MGALDTTDPYKPVHFWEHIEGFEALSLASAETRDILNLGVGPGSLAKRLVDKYGMYVDAVDLNPKVIEAAQQYFGLTPSGQLHLFTDDARAFLKKSQKRYDVIDLDVFKYIQRTYYIPPHLTTQEFFQEAKSHLKKDGIFAMLVVHEENFISSEVATLQSVFAHVYKFDCAATHLLVASDAALPSSIITEHSLCVPVPLPQTGTTAKIYTDDYAPVSEFGGR
jgi:spermidine synthase